MSAMGNYLADLIARRKSDRPGYNAAALADELGILPSMITRYLQGERCKLATFERISRAINGEDAEQAELLRAFLLDQRAGPARDLVEIHTKDSTARVAETSNDSIDRIVESLNLDLRTRNALQYIVRGCAKSTRFRRSVQDIADIARFDILDEK